MRLRIALLVASLGFACSPALAEKVVLGKLGQALEEAKIHASPSARSRVYYKVKPYEYLVVRPSGRKGWTAVFMKNQSYGYVQTDAIVVLDKYEVTADVAPQPVASSRGGKAVLTSRSASAVAQYSLNFQGTPYKWGGNDLQGGIDCSGFVKELFKQAGVNLPRTAAQQLNVGKPITRLEHLQPGDRLYFWDHKRNLVGHTGIYLGRGLFVHSSSTRGGVATDDLRNPKWRRLLVAARR